MKVKVNRQLSNGNYVVRFAVSDFTPVELTKMQSFGVPMIQMQRFVAQPGRPAVRAPFTQPLTQINEQLAVSFESEEDAIKYQESVLSQIRQEMTALRDRKDNFTSTQEVDI